MYDFYIHALFLLTFTYFYEFLTENVIHYHDYCPDCSHMDVNYKISIDRHNTVMGEQGTWGQ